MTNTLSTLLGLIIFQVGFYLFILSVAILILSINRIKRYNGMIKLGKLGSKSGTSKFLTWVVNPPIKKYLLGSVGIITGFLIMYLGSFLII